MTTNSDLFQSDFNSFLEFGEQVRFKYYTQSYVSGSYDDDISLSQSGTDFWVSGIVQPISNKSSSDAMLLEQGKILLDDKKLYVIGTVQTSGEAPIKVGMNGSPTTEQYQILGDGQVTEWDINGVPVYKKLYLRYLTNGSFIGE